MSAVACIAPKVCANVKTCEILILCEDFAAYEQASEVCWRILVQLADDLNFSFKRWGFMELTDSESARAAIKASDASDVILLSFKGATMSALADEWLDALAGNQFKAEGILALVLDEPPGDAGAASKLVSRLEETANQVGMELLSLVQIPEQRVLSPSIRY